MRLTNSFVLDTNWCRASFTCAPHRADQIALDAVGKENSAFHCTQWPYILECCCINDSMTKLDIEWITSDSYQMQVSTSQMQLADSGEIHQ